MSQEHPTAALATVDYDRSKVTAGIVHFGVGNFHRSHQAMFLDRLLRLGEADTWGLCGVGVLPSDIRMRDALRAQDLEYTLVERHPDGAVVGTRIGSIVDYLYAPEELPAVLERLADPATRIVSLTITEGGYNISDTTGLFDETNPAVVADAQPGARPATVFGIVVAGLRLRREHGVAPFTVMSCDNVEGNGHVARGSFVAFARMADPELADWIEAEVHFPNSMVDRITPVTTDADRAAVAEWFGVDDAWPVMCEDFVQWVLEDDFPLGRPAYEEVGVQVVADVRPYELMKLRLLNASHQGLAYFGMMLGHDYAHEAATAPEMVALVTRYMDEEATPTLEAVPGIDLAAYKRQLVERFANPYIRDTLARLATDGADRIPKFLVPVVRERRTAGLTAPLSAAIVASWARYAELVMQDGRYPFQDRQRDAIAVAVGRQQDDAVGYLRNADWFGDLAEDAGFTDDFTAVYHALRDDGDPRDVLRAALDGSLR